MNVPISIDTNKKGAIANFLKEKAEKGATLYLPSSIFTIFAVNDLKDIIRNSNKVKFLFNKPTFVKKVIKGNDKIVKEFKLKMSEREKNVSEFNLEIELKNNLNQVSVASECYLLLEDKFEIRSVTREDAFKSSEILIDNESGDNYLIHGSNLELSMNGLGLTKNQNYDYAYALTDKSLIDNYRNLFNDAWKDKEATEDVKEELLKYISNLYRENSPELAYYITLFNLFQDKLVDEDESEQLKTATGITKTKVWNMLYNFQHDAVVGAIHKIQRYGGCIIADSVGLGKTFEALAIIKYYELKNERVLVLCPKKLRSNWTGFKQNTITNPLIDDKFRYDVLNHTDLSRIKGTSGDIDLSKINWGNYDLLVIDESHTFRNKPARNDRITRYTRLMESVIKQGIKTKVLLLSATPVNNRLADLKNQIALINADSDAALAKASHPIQSIEGTLRIAQGTFNVWAKLDKDARTTEALLNNLDYSFFDVLDTYTIARSRKHIQKYYDTKDIGNFPKRRKPISLYIGTDKNNKFPPISKMNAEILKLHLCIYSPLSYVLGNKREEYLKKYETQVKGGKVKFSQIDREKNLVNLMRINILKRLESGVNSFKLTVDRILEQVNTYLDKIDGTGTTSFDPSFDEDEGDDELEEIIDEEMEIGTKIKVKVADMDLIKFKNDLVEDKNLLSYLRDQANLIKPVNDLKLEELKHQINLKFHNPINGQNRKIIVFTAFADTAKYLYENVSKWALEKYNMHSAIITGSSKVETNLEGVANQFETILTYFSPKSNHFETNKEIDILFATDCISEGQNLQDCDFLINYDIHWNPVRIIQRFGRIDRIGSTNKEIQLVNFWPDMSLDEYIKLENRVRSRMTMVDVTATGEDDLLDSNSKDLEYRKDQLLQLQNEVVDIDELKGGLSITDLTLDDFIMALRRYHNANPELLAKYPTGIYAITNIPNKMKDECVPGVIFCLKQKNTKEKDKNSSSIFPNYLVYVTMNGDIHVKYSNPKKVLDMYKGLCSDNKNVLVDLVKEFNSETKNCSNMKKYTELLKNAVYDIKGVSEKKGIDALFGFSDGSLLSNQIKGVNDFELISFLIIK